MPFCHLIFEDRPALLVKLPDDGKIKTVRYGDRNNEELTLQLGNNAHALDHNTVMSSPAAPPSKKKRARAEDLYVTVRFGVPINKRQDTQSLEHKSRTATKRFKVPVGVPTMLRGLLWRPVLSLYAGNDLKRQTAEDETTMESRDVPLAPKPIEGKLVKVIDLDDPPKFVKCYADKAYMTYDEGNSVLVLDVDTGTTVEEWTVPESGMLSDIAVYGGHLFVTDALKNCIYVLDMEGKRERSFGTKGSGDGQFKCPEGLAIADELIYICDCGNGRVQVFTLDGTWVRAWGSKGVGKGEFKSPSSITVHDGEVYVADTENCRTQVFDLNGNFRRVYGFESYPFGVIVHDEFVYMTDGLNDRIQIWDLAENTSVGLIGHFGSDIGELNMPVGLCVDYMDRLWVCDKDNCRLQVFR